MNEAEMKLIGDLLQVKFNTRRLNRFWSSVSNTSLELECWEWRKGLTVSGYGKVKMRPKTLTAHRIAYVVAYKESPALIMHTCDNRKCCNPAHLRSGTHKENMADMAIKGRQAFGDRHGRTHLSDSDVLALRKMYASGATVREIAAHFKLKKGSVCNIASGRYWDHLPDAQPIRRPIKAR